jgi:glycosyltransferase involved in cell wall biosynthesis
VILVLHNRYRTTGGEERAVQDQLWLLRERLGEEAALLERDSALLGRTRAARGMLGGGLEPEEIAAAVRRTGARIVSVHNASPSIGWRGLAAAREAGARVVLHLHNYRLVCAVAVCFTRGEDCTRCHGRNTLPGVRLRCRGSLAEAAVYAVGLALWQRRLADLADVFVVPSEFARERLLALGAPLGDRCAVVPHFVRDRVPRSRADQGEYAIVAGRLAPEKGFDVAIEAARRAELPLVVAGDGPERGRLEALGGGARFTGLLAPEELERRRARAALAIVPSRSAETFGLAAAEAMAAGVPVVASRIGALPDLVEDAGLVTPGDVEALAATARARYADAQAGERGLRRVAERASPEAAARALAAAYSRIA